MSKIINLKISNVMRLKAIEINPDQSVVIVGGRNAQGKTSTLDSISMLIGGLKFGPPEPIRLGENHAEIEGQLGEFHLKRTYDRTPTGIKSKLIVKDADGASLKSPQAILDGLTGTLSFDPLEFADGMNRQRQASTLRELVGLDVEQLEEELSRIYARRTEKGQEKRAAQAVVDDLPWYADIGARKSVVEIGHRMTAAVHIERAREQRIGDIERKRRELAAYNQAITQLNHEIGLLMKRRGEAENSVDRTREALDSAVYNFEEFVEPENIGAIEADLAGVENHNQQVDANDKRMERAEYANQIAQEWKALDEEHDTIATNIRKQTEAVEYPIDNLELRREGVYFQGVPFEQSSRAERIKVSLAMGMAMNRGMRVLLIRDGSVLDEESMELIHEFAETRDFQIWIEMARGYEQQPGAIIIEDGEVVS